MPCERFIGPHLSDYLSRKVFGLDRLADLLSTCTWQVITWLHGGKGSSFDAQCR